MTPLDHALAYAARDWRVAPIPAGLIHPGRDDWQLIATTDPAVIGEWWTAAGRWRAGDDPSAYGVCIVTGTGSGLFVVDVDPRQGGDDTLADLEHEHGPLPDTVEAITGSGGRHLYFRRSPRRAASGWRPPAGGRPRAPTRAQPASDTPV